MEVGDYVRNKYGISKVIDIKNNNGIDIVVFDKNICFLVNKETGEIKDDKLFNQLAITKNIDINKVKSSPNIIDLIEVGDIITFKEDGDVYKVIQIPNKEYGNDDIFYLYKEYDGETEDIMVYKKDMKKYINSILTKEQFERMEYKMNV